ncbi:hypothetical protein BaRGS_00008354 [Batillaria attramentaria]|uniref:Uncharacterized protein n=1 Tax=Batillaria attramentaria TaxID=370345 RepID=A0ABD0LLK2_9CAEN
MNSSYRLLAATERSCGYSQRYSEITVSDHVTLRDSQSVKLSGDVTKDEDHVTAPCCPFGWMGEVKNAIKRHRVPICLVVKVLVFLLYLAYTVYSLYRTWGTESATRLLVLLVIVLYAAVGRRLLKLFQNLLPKPTTRGATASKLRKIARWSLYVLAAGGAIVFLAVEVIPHHPNNLVCLLGLAALFIACLAMSTDPTHVRSQNQ